MQTCCPKCKTIVRGAADEWTIVVNSCPDLVGTQWEGSPQYCPLLTIVAEPDISLPGVTMRAEVQAEIDVSKVVNLSAKQS